MGAFEKWVLRRTVWSRRKEVADGWTKLHNEKLHNLYYLSNIIMIIKSRRL
jgi:hypothetical protein